MMPPRDLQASQPTPAESPGRDSTLGSSSTTEPQVLSLYPAIPPPLDIPLIDTGVHPCSYLPDRNSSNRAFWADALPTDIYQAYMDAGFRRSGKIIYQPACLGCRKCISIRVPVAEFQASKSQRRVWRKNQDLVVSVAEPAADSESYQLYRKYVTQWHGRAEDPDEDRDDASWSAFVTFLYESPVRSLEYRYRDQTGRLIGVGICDLSAVALSSVYFYYDPDASHRSLGTYAALYEIERCRNFQVPYYYLGYWIDGCRTMSYKSSYRPYELLQTDGKWRRMSMESAGDSAPTSDSSLSPSGES